jgi:hypothetical protein
MITGSGAPVISAAAGTARLIGNPAVLVPRSRQPGIYPAER